MEHTRVISLTEVSEKTGRRRGVNDTAILLLSEMRPCSSCALKVLHRVVRGFFSFRLLSSQQLLSSEGHFDHPPYMRL